MLKVLVMPSRKIIFISIVLIAFFFVLSIIFMVNYLPSSQDADLDILLKECSRSVEKLRYTTPWDNNTVLVYNNTIVTGGLTRKVIYAGREYIIPVSNGTHFIVYDASMGSFPLYSKGVFPLGRYYSYLP